MIAASLRKKVRAKQYEATTLKRVRAFFFGAFHKFVYIGWCKSHMRFRQLT
jgi:hypothetical protein